MTDTPNVALNAHPALGSSHQLQFGSLFCRSYWKAEDGLRATVSNMPAGGSGHSRVMDGVPGELTNMMAPSSMCSRAYAGSATSRRMASAQRSELTLRRAAVPRYWLPNWVGPSARAAACSTSCGQQADFPSNRVGHGKTAEQAAVRVRLHYSNKSGDAVADCLKIILNFPRG